MKCTSLSTARFIIGTAPKGVHPSISRVATKPTKKEETAPTVAEEPVKEVAQHEEPAPAEELPTVEEAAAVEAPAAVTTTASEEIKTEEVKEVKKTTKRVSKKKA